MTKEEFYDEKISPLMAQIIDLVKEANINMAATFALDPNEDGEVLFCSTVLPLDEADEDGMKRIRECSAVMYPKPTFMAFTIHSGGK